jgi:hypothetical protein
LGFPHFGLGKLGNAQAHADAAIDLAVEHSFTLWLNLSGIMRSWATWRRAGTPLPRRRHYWREPANAGGELRCIVA